jgi:hypothetical protein
MTIIQPCLIHKERHASSHFLQRIMQIILSSFLKICLLLPEHQSQDVVGELWVLQLLLSPTLGTESSQAQWCGASSKVALRRTAHLPEVEQMRQSLL